MAWGIHCQNENLFLRSEFVDSACPDISDVSQQLRRRCLRSRIHDRRQRIAGKDVLDIGQQQFLVLLFMVQSEFDRRTNISRIVSRTEQFSDLVINMSPESANILNQRPRQQTAPGPWMHLARRVVIGIEQVMILIVKTTVTFFVGFENETLEKPGRVRQMPLGWTHVRHTLNDVILGREVLTKSSLVEHTLAYSYASDFRAVELK